jgi:tetratricopeptide (TPR) repeat protein
MIARNLGFLAKTVPFASRKAEGYFTRAAEAAKDIGANSILAQSYLNLGLLHKAKDKKEKARGFLDEAIRVFEQCEADLYLKQAREALASLG